MFLGPRLSDMGSCSHEDQNVHTRHGIQWHTGGISCKILLYDQVVVVVVLVLIVAAGSASGSVVSAVTAVVVILVTA